MTRSDPRAIRVYVIRNGRMEPEWADTPHGRYESFVLDVVRAVDARWPTLADRRHRVLAGNSEGAYAAANAYMDAIAWARRARGLAATSIANLPADSLSVGNAVRRNSTRTRASNSVSEKGLVR